MRPAVRWSDLALARLASGDISGYRKTCADMLSHFGETRNPDIAMSVAWTCSLLPRAVTDPDRLVGLAETALGYGYRWPLGAALYRAGRFEESLRWLTEASAVQGAESRGSGRLFLAMCHARLGHPAEARRWLQRAVRWIEQTSRQKSGDAGATPLTWDQRLELRLLRAEAEALLRQETEGRRA